MQGWRAFTDSFSQNSQLRKYVAEGNTLITNEDIRNLHTSKPDVGGARIVQEAEKGAQLSIMQFTLSRDYLLCNLALATATRPSALNNVLLSDYDTSRVSEANQIILMPKHKRNKGGPAMLGMNLQMQAEMTTLYSKEKRILHVTQVKKKKERIYIIYLPGYNSNKIYVNVNIFFPLTNSFLPSLGNNGTVVQRLTQSQQITSILSSMLLSNYYQT